MRKILMTLGLLFSIFLSEAQKNKAKTKDPNDVRERMASFLTAFDNLNWEDFRSYFDEDATAFLESDTLTLIEGKSGIEKMFRPLFEEMPKRLKGPPYLHLQPLNMHYYFQRDMAIVSFHMKRGNMIARRTFVWKKQKNTLLIVHIHGSALPI